MKPASFVAFALTLVTAPAAYAQSGAPLLVESTGGSQEVRVEWRGPVACHTPCALQVQPGERTVWTGGRGFRMAEVWVTVPPEGARVRVRAVSRGRLVGGIILAALGGSALLTMGTLSLVAVAGSPDDEYNQFMATLLGGMGLLIGAPTLIGGILLLQDPPPGVESITPIAASPRWGLGVAPLSGGAMAGATVTF